MLLTCTLHARACKPLINNHMCARSMPRQRQPSKYTTRRASPNLSASCKNAIRFCTAKRCTQGWLAMCSKGTGPSHMPSMQPLMYVCC